MEIQIDPTGSFDRGLTEIIGVIRWLQRLIDDVVYPELGDIAVSAREEAEDRTPKDRDPRDIDDDPFSPQISDSWKIEDLPKIHSYRVYNDHREGNKEHEHGGTILLDLEYGTKAHRIKARRQPRLSFTDRQGRERHDIEVMHFGNRPFGMLGFAYAKGSVELAALTVRLGALVESVWATRGGTVTIKTTTVEPPDL